MMRLRKLRWKREKKKLKMSTALTLPLHRPLPSYKKREWSFISFIHAMLDGKKRKVSVNSPLEKAFQNVARAKLDN